jgi:hypothetical protein
MVSGRPKWAALIRTRVSRAWEPSLGSREVTECDRAVTRSHILVGQEREMPRALDRRGQLALILRAHARDAAVKDLAAIRDEAPQKEDVLVIDVFDLLRAEGADLSPGETPAWASAASVATAISAVSAITAGSTIARSTAARAARTGSTRARARPTRGNLRGGRIG